MKKIIFGFILTTSIFVHAESTSQLRDIALGVNFDMEHGDSAYTFPCSAIMGVVFCDNRVIVEDQNCSSSLKLTKLSDARIAISCDLKTGEKFEIAKTSSELFNDDTQSMGYYFLEFNKRISLRKTLNQDILIIN